MVWLLNQHAYLQALGFCCCCWFGFLFVFCLIHFKVLWNEMWKLTDHPSNQASCWVKCSPHFEGYSPQHTPPLEKWVFRDNHTLIPLVLTQFSQDLYFTFLLNQALNHYMKCTPLAFVGICYLPHSIWAGTLPVWFHIVSRYIFTLVLLEFLL